MKLLIPLPEFFSIIGSFSFSLSFFAQFATPEHRKKQDELVSQWVLSEGHR